MSEASEFADLFGPRSDADKEESFEKSTLKLILQQLGAAPAQVRKWRYEEAFDEDWFNGLAFLNSQVYLKFFKRISLVELMETPSRSELVQHWLQVIQPRLDQKNPEPTLLVYDTSHYKGRMVCTNIALPERGHIHVVYRNTKLNLTPFQAFFSERYGSCIPGELDAQ